LRIAGERNREPFPDRDRTVLRVTPHITEDETGKSLRMVVAIEDGSPATDTPVDNIPIINNSVVNTQAMVAEGESLLLGGFIRTEENRHRFPGPAPRLHTGHRQPVQEEHRIKNKSSGFS